MPLCSCRKIFTSSGLDDTKLSGAELRGDPEGDDVPRGQPDVGPPDLDQQEIHRWL